MNGTDTLYRFLSAHLAESRLQGVDTPWIAPMAHFRSPDGFGEEVWLASIPQTLIVVCLKGSKVRHCASRGRVSGQGSNVALLPRQMPTRFVANEDVTFGQIFISDELLDRAADVRGQPRCSSSLRDDLVFRNDYLLEARMRSCITRAFDHIVPPSALEMEALTLLVLDRLLDLHCSQASRDVSGGLAPWQLKRITDFIEDHLSEDISLAVLSAMIGLSPYHLCRAFKASTGLPPHRWLLTRRIERACGLLEQTALSISEVSALVGYDDPSQLAVAFRKMTGLSPTRYRRERLI